MRAITPKDLRDLMIVRCKDCKHRPFINTGGVHIYPPRMRAEEPKDRYSHDQPDETCPFLCDDEYYNRMPPDDFFCAYGERGET